MVTGVLDTSSITEEVGMPAVMKPTSAWLSCMRWEIPAKLSQSRDPKSSKVMPACLRMFSASTAVPLPRSPGMTLLPLRS